MRTAIKFAPVVVFFSMAILSCSTTSHRVDLDSDVLSGDTGINSKDFRTVCEQMARSIIQIPQIANAASPPRISFVKVRNMTSEPLDKDMFSTKIRTLLLKNSGGKVLFVDRAEGVSSKIEDEREMKRSGELTASKMGAKSGVDYFLTGEISSIDKMDGARKATYTIYSFRLTDAETSDIVWEDNYEVKKAVRFGIYER